MNQRSLVEGVQETARQHPDRDALIHPGAAGDGGGPGELRAEHLSYRELDRAARAVAAWVADHGHVGRPVLVATSSGRHFAVALLGCLYAGAVAVPAAPLDPDRSHREDRLLRMVQDSSAALVLSCGGDAPAVSCLLARAGVPGVDCFAVDTAALSDQAGPAQDPDRRRHSRRDADPVLLHYTPGRSATPRRTVVTQGLLTHRQQTLRRSLRTAPGDRIGGWLPTQGGGALFAHLLHALWLGGTAVVTRTDDFRRSPLSWLRSIADYGVRAGTSPGLGYLRCVRAFDAMRQDSGTAAPLDLDLSCWETATGGSEPLRPEVMRDFAERFAPFGFRPEAFVSGYGPTGTGVHLLANGARGGDGLPAARAFAAAELSNGVLRPADAADGPGRLLVGVRAAATADTPATGDTPAAEQVRVLVTDPASERPLPPGRIGEIRLGGAGVSPDGEFQRTGDLGALLDGELFVTGRLDSGLRVGWTDVHPEEIERVVHGADPLFGATAAFPGPAEGGCPDEETDVVVVQELRSSSVSDPRLAQAAERLRACLGREFELEPLEVVLVRPGTLRRTASALTGRSAVRARYLGGKLLSLQDQTAGM
jgi:acyl-CoA synthetase (AMP-forming)/AMP-acid ligase II